MTSTEREAEPLTRLREALAGGPPLPALAEGAYADAHGPYEDRSDQRARLLEWLTGTVGALLAADRPGSVLSLGTGDGSVDAPLAAALGRGGRRLQWLVVEPDARVGQVCVDRLRAAGVADVGFHRGRFDTVESTAGDERFDVVLAVHSFYYVPDLPAALAAAADRVAEGGAVVVLLAPLEGICRLTDLLAPRPDGVRQWWSGDLLEVLRGTGGQVTTERIDGRLDVTDCFDPRSAVGARVLDFLVQADCSGLPGDVPGRLLAALAALAGLASDGDHGGDHGGDGAGVPCTVAHPVDAVVWRPIAATVAGRDG